MAETCWKAVRGKVVRVTTVDACGSPPAAEAEDAQAATDGFIQVSYTAVWEAGDEITQKTANGALCVNDKSPDQFKRYDVKVQFCGVDPELLNLMTNAPLETDANGVVVGFRYGENLPVADFALELWSGVPGTACALSNEVQSLTEGGSGLTSWTITFSGQTTSSLDDDADASAVLAALNALSNIEPGDVIVTGGPLASGPFFVTFSGQYAGQNVAAMTTTPTGGTGTVVVATVQAGGVFAGEVFGYFLLPHVTNGTLRDWTIQNGVTTFEVAGYTSGDTTWLRGPYEVVANSVGAGTSLIDPMVTGDHLLAILTTIAPPSEFCQIGPLPAAPTPPD